MQYTTYLNLKKPDYTDNVDVADLNDNADAIDSAIGDVEAVLENLIGEES